MDVVVFGNVTLDIICQTVDDVPRHESIAFDRVVVSPGGCASNLALGLAALGVDTGLIACCGDDDAGALVSAYWKRAGLDLSYIRRDPEKPTGTSVGLVDSDLQPRFIHTSGANAGLTADDLPLVELVQAGAGLLVVTGFYVLPGILDGRLAERLHRARQAGMTTILDVVHSPRMDQPEPLWPLLPHLDIFLCNTVEASRISGRDHHQGAASFFREKGAGAVVVKLGERGCWLESDEFSGVIPTGQVQVIDTTGAGDAFAAGLTAGLLRDESLMEACRSGNAAASRVVAALGAIAGWGY
jgi:sugar/nucleoside kinase (ribokinase family)